MHLDPVVAEYFTKVEDVEILLKHLIFSSKEHENSVKEFIVV